MSLNHKSGAIDQFRLIAAFLVVANHTSPLLTFGEDADFILTRIIARIAVPFFLMVSGYFLYKQLESGNKLYIWSFCKKLVLLYICSIVLFLPLNLYAGHYKSEGWGFSFLKDLLINGTFYHLWYFPGLILGVLIVVFCMRKIGLRLTFFLSLFLYVIGLFGDSYYGVIKQIPYLESFYNTIFSISDYTRNGLFMVPLFLTMGMLIYQITKRGSFTKNISLLFLSLVFLIVEGLLLYHHSLQRHDSMYIMLLPTMYYLFLCLLQIKGTSSRNIRTLSVIIYIIHPWMIVIVRFTSDFLNWKHLFVENSLLHFCMVSFLSFAVALMMVYWRKETASSTSRAWVEIDLQALRENIRALKELIPSDAKLMAVVKANAYGHGAVKIARELNKQGIKSFAVATLAEGIELRKHRIKGEVLILGYTNPEEIHRIKRYRLTQTVVDLSHAKELNKHGVKIQIQIKLDTGMHRLGFNPANSKDLKALYNCHNLRVTGIFSHLSVSDSLTSEDIHFTNKQVETFNQTIKWLESQLLPTGKQHIQASYGILNYPTLQYDYVRAGIALYGVLSKNDKVYSNVKLQPVLALKARIAVVQRINPGEFISYGRAYQAKQKMKIAIVTIGYADGLPRNINKGYVLIQSQKAPIISRICMDQLIVDISHLEHVQISDVVTLIGKDGKEQIASEDVAEKSGTITNELLSRLGSRLDYVYKGGAPTFIDRWRKLFD